MFQHLPLSGVSGHGVEGGISPEPQRGPFQLSKLPPVGCTPKNDVIAPAASDAAIAAIVVKKVLGVDVAGCFSAITVDRVNDVRD